MNLVTFLEQLCQHKGQFKLNRDGRLRSKISNPLECRCPLEVVAETGPFTVTRAATKLGLSNQNARRIIMAADADPGHSRSLRARMLEAVGLKEAWE